MSIGQRSLFGMLTGGVSVVIKTGLNILLIPVLISKLGLDVFGLYILLIAIFEVSILLDLGATDALVAKLSASTQTQAEKRAYLKVGNLLLSGLALIGLLLGLGVAPWFSSVFNISVALAPMAQTGFLLIVIESALMLYSAYSQAILLAHCSQQWTNLADTTCAVIVNVGALLALLAGGDLVSIMALRLVGTTVRLLILTVQTHRVEPYAYFPKVPFSTEAAGSVIRLSGHAMMINFSIIVSHKIDDIVIARFLPLSAVGIYEIVFRFLGVVIQICIKLHEGVYPLLARMASLNQPTEARQLFLRMSCFLNFVACMMLMLIVSFYQELFVIFSAGKVPVAQTLPILAVAVPCVLSGVLQMPANALLFTWGRQRFLSITSLLAAGANLGLSLILVHYLGILGVALGTLLPQLIQHQWGLVGQSCRTLNISWGQYLKAVHGAIILPVSVSFLWVQLWRMGLGTAAAGLFPISLIALGAVLLGSFLWFRFSATAIERDLLNALVAQFTAKFSKLEPSQ
ncbi:lipopolysaccharide biosynthesis protein [Vampirovibrio sp.]|uniref:lipopolysaccharide biosynthesis protein n=1 Tax=Vampirovibrio sp. TaxID=2717857 RepID=UPI0035941166